MAPTKRTPSPTTPPSWVTQIINELTALRAQLATVQRSIDQLSRQGLSTQRPSQIGQSSNTSHQPSESVAARRSTSTSQVVARPSNRNRSSTPRPTRRQEIASRATIMHRHCWFHRQFGLGSAKCNHRVILIRIGMYNIHNKLNNQYQQIYRFQSWHNPLSLNKHNKLLSLQFKMYSYPIRHQTLQILKMPLHGVKRISLLYNFNIITIKI